MSISLMFPESWHPIYALSLLVVAAVAWIRSRRRSVSHVRGPSQHAELLVGHDYLFSHQTEAHAIELQWFQQYGNVFRFKGSLHRDILLAADPKALQYILQTSSYRFPKPQDINIATEAMFGGKGIISSTGESHSRQRRVLLPAFSTSQLRTFLGVFHNVGSKLTSKWTEMIQPEGTILDVSDWMARATLEVVGQSAFEYDFQSLEGGSLTTEIGAALDNIFVESSLFPSRTALLYQALLRVSPSPVARILAKLPSKQNDRFRKYHSLTMKVVERIITERRSAVVETTDQDVLSVLLRANTAEDPKKRLTDRELACQIALIIIAGHDTTSGTISFTLWELAKAPEIQKRLRDEIRQARARNGAGVDFTSAQYDAMPLLNATVKEALRLHPVAATVTRQAGADDLIPLSEPLMTDKGAVTEIPVAKNQDIQISIAAYNRLPSIWGDDAHKWNPERWLNPDRSAKKDVVSVGMTSNLMSFSAGVQGCIGWRFAFMELQTLTAQIIENFEFALPEGQSRVLRLPTTNVMLPALEGQIEKGIQLPLHVKLVSQDV